MTKSKMRVATKETGHQNDTWIALVALLLSAMSLGIIIIDRRDKERERLAIVECVLHIDQRCKANADR
jgi:LPXTG-motif cell wall-anchored protein